MCYDLADLKIIHLPVFNQNDRLVFAPMNKNNGEKRLFINEHEEGDRDCLIRYGVALVSFFSFASIPRRWCLATSRFEKC